MNVKKKIAFFMSLALLASASAAVVTQSPDLLGLDSLFSLTATAADSGTCGDRTTWAFADGVLTISGTGAVYEYSSDDATPPWIDRKEQITELAIGKDVTNINLLLFDDYSNLTKITVAEGNTAYSAENGVLYNADKTAILYYPKGIAGGTFVIPSNVKEIGPHAFYNAMVSEVHVPISVNKVGKEAFEGGGETPLKMYFADYPSYIAKAGYGTNTELYIGGEAAVKDYTMSDYFDMTDVEIIADTSNGLVSGIYQNSFWIYLNCHGKKEYSYNKKLTD